MAIRRASSPPPFSTIGATNQPMTILEEFNLERLRVFLLVCYSIHPHAIDRERVKRLGLLHPEREQRIRQLASRIKPYKSIINTLENLETLERTRKLEITNDFDKDVANYVEQQKSIAWMEDMILQLKWRYNSIGELVNFEPEEFFPNVPEPGPVKVDYISKEDRLKEEQRRIKFTERELFLDDTRSSTELLKTKIVSRGIVPNYKLLSKTPSDKFFVYKYSCSLFGMNVEGSGYCPSEGKEDTATNMLRLILKKQNDLTLSKHIRPISDKELKEVKQITRATENYVRQLEKICFKKKCSMPKYELMAYTNEDKDTINTTGIRYTYKCNTNDFIGIGHSNKQSTAKQVAARGVIDLIDRLKHLGPRFQF